MPNDFLLIPILSSTVGPAGELTAGQQNALDAVSGFTPLAGESIAEGRIVTGPDNRDYIALVDTTMPASFPNPDFEEYSPSTSLNPLSSINATTRWHSFINDLRAGTPKTVLVTGDSLTMGTGTAPLRPYSDWLSEWIDIYYPFANITFINVGIGGQTMLQIRDRLEEEITTHNPDAIIFNGGTNDSSTGVSVEDYLQAFQDIVDLCADEGLACATWTIPPRLQEHGIGGGLESSSRAHNLRLAGKSLAAQLGVPIADVYQDIFDLYKNRALIQNELSPDESHYSTYQYIAGSMFRHLFASDDINVSDGQFILPTSRMLEVGGGSSSSYVDVNSAYQAVTIEDFRGRLWFWYSGKSPAKLIIHAAAESALPDRNPSFFIQNLMSENPTQYEYSTESPLESGGAPTLLPDYLIPTVYVIPGLNIIELDTQSGTDRFLTFVGASIRCEAGDFPTQPPVDGEPRIETLHGGAWERSRDFSTEILPNPVVFNRFGFPAHKLADIVPPGLDEVYRLRMRVFANERTSIFLGALITASTNRAAWEIRFTDTQVQLFLGVFMIAEEPIATFFDPANWPTGKDLQIDIRSDNLTTTIWVDRVVLYTANIPLCAGDLTVQHRSGDNNDVTTVVSSIRVRNPDAHDTNNGPLETWWEFEGGTSIINTDINSAIF